MSGIYDWSEDQSPEDTDEPRLFSLVERIREYVRDNYEGYTRDVQREVAAVEAYIERGHGEIEVYLQRHAEFDAWLAERSETNA